MILQELKDHFINNAQPDGVGFYVGIAPPKDTTGNPVDLPYVVLVPQNLSTEYVMVTGDNRPTIDTLDFEFHVVTRSSDDLEDLMFQVTQAFDNTSCCGGWMNTDRKNIRFEFPSAFQSVGVITYQVIYKTTQNVNLP